MKKVTDIKGPLLNAVLFRGYNKKKVQEILDGDEYDMICVYATARQLINKNPPVSDYLTIWVMPGRLPDKELIELFNKNYEDAGLV